VLAAARDNNPEKESSASQFYIVEGKRYTDEELDKLEQAALKGLKYPNGSANYTARWVVPPSSTMATLFMARL